MRARMAAPASIPEVKRANVRYHDLAAGAYDAKWGITFDARGREQVVGKLTRALGHAPPRFGRALEIGAGTGYFTLNLMRAGVIAEATATDISPGMLRRLEASAAELGLAVETVPAEASDLPFADESFDLVLGHAVLHHLPDLERAFAELARVLRPGGTLAFCGEPSRHGDRLAAIPKRAAVLAAPLWRRALGAAPRSESEAKRVEGAAGTQTGPATDGGQRGSVPPRAAAPASGVEPSNGRRAPARGLTEEQVLEWAVDVHAFTPGDLARSARAAGLEGVRVRGEELAASWFGWVNRTLEGTAEREALPRLWYTWAYHGYLALQRLDRALLEPRLPAWLFYNLLLSARKPGRR